jgi:uncharacterized membrane protein
LAVELLTAVVTISVLARLAWRWPDLPDRIPSHWNATGEVDGWSTPSSLLLLVATLVVSVVGLTVLNRYPHVFNYFGKITAGNARRQYRLGRSQITTLKLLIAVTFGWIIVVGFDSDSSGLGPIFLVTVSAGPCSSRSTSWPLRKPPERSIGLGSKPST